jgi:hypothetical protein
VRTWSEIREWVEENPFDPVRQYGYTGQQLEDYASMIIWRGGEPVKHGVLLPQHLKHRVRHEIYCGSGQPDPTFLQGMYWRVHVDGLRWNSEEDRKLKGRGFYR